MALAPLKLWLADTCPLVAYLDPKDPAHERVGRTLESFTGELVSAGAVVTEAMHFVAEAPNGPGSLADLIARSGMRIYDLCQPQDVRNAASLMERYRDTPMDFADATLVLLAEALGASDILTLDRKGFATYRTERGDGFQLVMDSISEQKPATSADGSFA